MAVKIGTQVFWAEVCDPNQQTHLLFITWLCLSSSSIDLDPSISSLEMRLAQIFWL